MKLDKVGWFYLSSMVGQLKLLSKMKRIKYVFQLPALPESHFFHRFLDAFRSFLAASIWSWNSLTADNFPPLSSSSEGVIISGRHHRWEYWSVYGAHNLTRHLQKRRSSGPLYLIHHRTAGTSGELPFSYLMLESHHYLVELRIPECRISIRIYEGYSISYFFKFQCMCSLFPFVHMHTWDNIFCFMFVRMLIFTLRDTLYIFRNAFLHILKEESKNYRNKHFLFYFAQFS